MPTYNLTINLTEDGQPLAGFPLVVSKVVQEAKGKQTFNRPDAAATFTELPLAELGDINILLARADQAGTYRFNDQSDAGIPMNANGIILLFDSNIPTAATSKASLENASGSQTQVVQVAGGN